MSGQKFQTDQLVVDDKFKGLANYQRQALTQTLELISDKVTYPAKVELFNLDGTDSILQVHASPLQKLYGDSVSSVGSYINECLAAVDSQYQIYPESFIDISDGSVTGAIDISNVSGTTTNGYYRWMMLYADSVSGNFGIALGSEAAVAPAFGANMPTPPELTLPLAVVRVQNSGGGAWNFSRPDFGDIFNISRGGAGGGGGGGSLEITQEQFTISSPQDTFTLTDITPDEDMLKCYHVQTGQVYVCGVSGLSLSGQNVNFPTNSFDYVTSGNVATLIFEQPNAVVTRIVH